MSRQSRFIAPYAGIINDDASLDTILGVVDILWRVCVNDFDLITIGNEGLALLIDTNRALENAMNRVSS